MKITKLGTVAVLALMAFSLQSEARERIVLYPDQAVYGSRTGPLMLKKLIKQQAPKYIKRGLRNGRYDLKKVVLRAEFIGHRRNSSTAYLMVGGREQARATIYENYRGYRPEKTVLRNYGSSQGPWQVDFRGRTQVNKVVVVLEEAYDYYDYDRPRYRDRGPRFDRHPNYDRGRDRARRLRRHRH